MRSVALIGLALGLLWGSPTRATEYALRWTGAVDAVEGDLSGAGIQTGDAISASFRINSADLGAATILPLGGGYYTIYLNAPLSDFAISVGNYATTAASRDAVLTYVNDSFGMDDIVVGADGLPGGPFGSTFANIQFQAFGPTSAIDGSGAGNGLPYHLFTQRFFAVFGNGTRAERVFGALTVAESVIPEPAAWTLMGAGLGLAGATLRARRRWLRSQIPLF